MLETSFEDRKKTLAANEQHLRIATTERDFARCDALLLKTELAEAKTSIEEVCNQNDLLVRTKAREIAEV